MEVRGWRLKVKVKVKVRAVAVAGGRDDGRLCTACLPASLPSIAVRRWATALDHDSRIRHACRSFDLTVTCVVSPPAGPPSSAPFFFSFHCTAFFFASPSSFHSLLPPPSPLAMLQSQALSTYPDLQENLS